MYCKNCGKEIDDLAAVCIHCGVAVGNGVKYCKNCGAELPEEAAFCLKCGVAVGGRRNGFNTSGATVTTDPNAKSRLAAGLLAIFLGAFGVHNFYLGYNGKAVAQLLMTVLSCGVLSFVSSVWALIEGIFYLVEKEGYMTDAKGNPLGEYIKDLADGFRPRDLSYIRMRFISPSPAEKGDVTAHLLRYMTVGHRDRRMRRFPSSFEKWLSA